MWRVVTITLISVIALGNAYGQSTQEEIRAVVLVIDKSGSMREQNRIAYVKQSAKSIAQQLNDTDYFGVVAFDLKPVVIINLDQVGRLRQQDLIDKQIEGVKPAGQTHFFPALAEAKRQFEAVGSAKKHIVLFSDGVTRGSQLELIDLVVGMKKEQAISISTVAISADADARLMRRIALYGGGSFQIVCNPSDMRQMTLASILRQAGSEERTEDAQKCP